MGSSVIRKFRKNFFDIKIQLLIIFIFLCIFFADYPTIHSPAPSGCFSDVNSDNMASMNDKQSNIVGNDSDVN